MAQKVYSVAAEKKRLPIITWSWSYIKWEAPFSALNTAYTGLFHDTVSILTTSSLSATSPQIQNILAAHFFSEQILLCRYGEM